nr:TatD family hydrolase [candidate division KSB1 bacterium]NIR68606.1 TatD family hydrolase [candidate division KSB1 bacterium]NIS25443.1 TatD family hydrolase [candidate division KSB1 bacterium]NIT72335.1 TatD family hydrolase [candidate division KSB1 bacterium]NIU26119.1 TatD family hydrolase [candidate division KSB1 bacterium]
RCLELAEEYDGLYAAVGIHPNDSTRLNDHSLSELRELTQHDKAVAIGEIGLDFYWDKSPVHVQEQAFRAQINLAKELGLPIVIHNREAGREILDVLKSEGTEGLAGMFHCFSEDKVIAEEVLAVGFHISFTGNLTFKKSELPEVANLVPLTRLLLETDSPFLSPEPKRGRRNEPSHVAFIANKLAEIKGVDVTELRRVTTENAHKLFGLGQKDME